MGDHNVNNPPGNFFQFLLKIPQHLGRVHETGNQVQEAVEEVNAKETVVEPVIEDQTKITTPSSSTPATTVSLVEETPTPTRFNYLDNLKQE